jgi:signal transduction histidine kinase/ActR/RegA family two-component response regulator
MRASLAGAPSTQMDGPSQTTLEERLTLVSDIARDLLGARKPSEVVTGVFDRVSAHLGLEVSPNHLATDGGSAPRLEPDEVELLRTVSDLVALALERERLVRALEEATVERQRAEEALRLQAEREQGARADAEYASRAKDEFLAVLSHELRTPLNVVLGWVRMLRSAEFDAAGAAHALEVIERNIRAQADLINELLDVSRIVSGKLSLDMRPLELRRIAESAIDSVLPSAESKGVKLRRDLDGPPLRVSGDAARLQQVVLNLLTNAVKFTPPGGVIAVRLEAAGPRARLTVSDTGEGIAPELLPHVFDRHRQRDTRSTRAHGGLGLGLAIVRRLVELHGGAVEAASAGSRRGATFTVTLPLARAERPDPSAPAAGPPSGAEERLDGVRVLVVDDHADSCELLSVMLRDRGAVVASAGSVAEAHRLLGTFAPAIVLCDISMPGEDGFRLLEWIKDGRQPPTAVPVIAVTAHARPEDRQRALAAGFTAHLPKPLDPADVVRAIRSAGARCAGGAGGVG